MSTTCIFPASCINEFHTILKMNDDYFLNGINWLVFVLDMEYVFFKLAAALLNVTEMKLVFFTLIFK
jgi:hypothetical protein